MDEDSGQFVPLTEERHSPASQVDPADQDGTSSNTQPDVRVSPVPFDHYSDKDNMEAMRTVIRRDGSPALSSERKRMIEYVPGDNDELFTPAKTLNFTDADETETDMERSVDHETSFMKSAETDLNHDSNGMRNQRIIEGHDSSPMDHGVSVRLHGRSSPVAMVTMSPGSNHLRKLSVESQDISPNLYDSLDEKEDMVYQYTNQHQSKYDMQYQNETDLFQKPNSIFSPLQPPHHQMQGQKESPINFLQSLALVANRDCVHSSPHSEPLPSAFLEKTSLQHQTMSQSLPEATNRGNYEEFQNNLGQKTESVPVSTSESEWYAPSVSVVSTEPAKPPVDHIALNIQRVKNSSKANKNGTQSLQSGDCPRLNRIDSKPNNQNRKNGNGHTKPNVKSSDHPRPVVQGSSGQDSQSFSANQRQGQGNFQHPAERVSRHSYKSSGRYGGVGGEVRSNGGQNPVVISSPGSGVTNHYLGREQQRATESQSMPTSYVQHHGYSSGKSPPLHDHETVTTQIGQIRSPRGYQSSPGQSRGELYVDLQGMDGVRSHLQSMLRLSNDVIKGESSKFDHSDTASELLMDQPLNPQLKFDSSSLMGSRVQEEVSELVENFPNLSSKIFSDMSTVSIGRQESAVNTENQYLRDVMEKERYRRKHCEQHIQQLNSKLLETQQQLAVAVSTDKRKDIMIEQLDKQLAKVVEGWKKREREKDDYLNLLVKEKKQVEDTLNKQQAMMNNFERDLSDTVAELKREKENSAIAIEDLRSELEKKTREKVQAEEVLAGEQERVGLVMQEWEQLKQSRELAEDRAQQLQDKLHKEQDDWYRREQELVAKIDDVKEANLKVIQMERLKSEERERRSEELEETKHSLETDNKRLELELDEVQREKESLKVEMAILEAKFESSQRKLEADLHSQMEKEISEQVGEVHQKMEQMQDELQDKHRQHVAEIHARHQRDTERQIQQFHEDSRRSEENYRQTIQDLEERLTEYRNENATLNHAKQKLESQRMEILTKMQYMMQSQWNEAVSLLVSSPHKRNTQAVNGTLLTGVTQPSTNLNLSIVSSGQPKTSSPNSGRVEQRGSPVSERESRVQRDSPDTDHVEQYNSLPASSHNPSQQESQGFLVSKNTAVDTSFSSDNSGPQLQKQSEFDPTVQGQVMTFPDLNLDQSLLSHLNPSVIPRHIHGYLVNQGSSLPSNQSVNLQALPNQNHAFYSLVNQPGAAVMLRPPQQQTHFYNQGQGAFLQSHDVGQGHISQGQVPQSPSRQRSQRRTHRRGQQRSTEYEDSDEDLLPPAPMYKQPGMSPPVKQSRQSQEEEGFNPRLSHRDLATPDQLAHALEDTVRLNADYSHISERVAEHESRQNELQHYIKMLLDRPPGSSPVQSVHEIPFTSDLETSRDMTGEIDLNDTAQAAQLNKELCRLQQLREQVSQRDAVLGVEQPEQDTARTQRRTPAPLGVLEPSQLEEISRLLDVYRQQGDTSQRVNDEAINQLLSLLQHLPPSMAPQSNREVSELDSGSKTSPRGTKQKGRGTAQKKGPPITMRPGLVKNLLDTSLAKSDSSQSGKNQPQKKVERKLACNQGNKQQNKSKLSAWK